jgi:hypothetical protein
MVAALQAALSEVSGVEGWRIEQVGGSRRQHRSPGRPDQAAAQHQHQQQQQQQQHSGQDSGEQGQPQEEPGGSAAVVAAPLRHPAAGPPSEGGSASAGSPPSLHHDADFIVSHPSHGWDEDFVGRLADELLERGRLMPPHQGAYLAVQAGGSRWPCNPDCVCVCVRA